MKTNPITLSLIATVVAFCTTACSKNTQGDDGSGTVPPPIVTTIKSFYPTTATTNDPVRIVGSNFTGVTNVSFGGSAAASFTVVSDTVIMAKVGAAGSGDVVATRSGTNASASGFTYYTPQQYNFSGISEYGAVGYPPTMPYQGITNAETCAFTIRKINLLDTPRLSQNGGGFPAIPSFAKEADYVILSGVKLETFSHAAFFGGGVGVYSFTTNVPADGLFSSVYAKITGSQITIPAQRPSQLSNIEIKGSGTLINGKITMHVETEYRGQTKKSDFVSQ